MALRDFFKRKKKPAPKTGRGRTGARGEEAKKDVSAEAVKPEEAAKKEEKKKPPAGGKEKKPVRKRKISNSSFGVLEAPFITEKAIDLTEQGKYTFRVSSKANKASIKKAVEDFYDVDVESVNIIKVPPKKRRIGKVSGWRGEFKKAVVKLKKGQKIEGLYP